ncbi:MAG: malate/lactate/ureidoglycolate dehydrogenase [Burkholderiaceae bacterium]
MIRIADPQRLEPFVAAIFRAAGSHDDEARQIAEHLVGANLAGHDSHGVGMIPAYLQHLREGFVHPNRRPERVGGTEPFSVFDGCMGYGQPIANAVTAEAAAVARRHGVSLTTLRNAQHVGRIGAYGERLSAQGLLAIIFVNAVHAMSCVAPFGGSEPRLMTNPICIAIPGPQPVLLDFATSAIAMGKTRVAYNQHAAVAPGRLIDHEGRPTTDPKVMWEDPRGALLPFGEHKGWGLAFVAELLGGVLAGGPDSSEAPGRPRGLVNGLFIIAMQPDRLIEGSVFEQTAARLTAYVKSSRPAAGAADPVRVPGEPEQAARRERERDGIPIDDTTWRQIVKGATALGVEPPLFPSRAA